MIKLAQGPGMSPIHPNPLCVRWSKIPQSSASDDEMARTPKTQLEPQALSKSSCHYHDILLYLMAIIELK